MKLPILLLSWLAICLSAGLLQAAGQSEQAVVNGSRACQAKILSKNSLVIPNHCLENDRTIILEDYGLRSIARIARKSSYQKASDESLVTVELLENVFPHYDFMKFKSPVAGAAVVRSNGIEKNCRVISVDLPTMTFTHDCAHFQGQSGSAIYQKNELVGLHLGQIKKSATYIAAMQNGPDFSKNPRRFESYEAQGLKISCCKKLEKAVDKLGDAITDGAEALKDLSGKTLESINAEIGRVSKDIEVLPKVFSVEYVQNRLPEVKIPKLPKIEMNPSIVDGSAFQWEMPSLKIPSLVYPRVDENSVLGKIRIAVAKGFDDTGNALTKAGQDAARWLPDTLKWLKDHARQAKPPKDCDDDATYDQLKACITGLKYEIEDQKAQLQTLRSGLIRWVDDQRSALGL